MGIDSVWIIVLAVSTPIAGVVGFAIQLRNVKKLRLENEKLNLEITNLERIQRESEQRIIPVSNDEVIKYGGLNSIKFSKTSQNEMLESLNYRCLGVDWEGIALISGAIFVLIYFCYDLYRFGKLVFSLFQ